MFFEAIFHRMFIKGEPDRVREVFDYIKGWPGDNELFDLDSIIPIPECIRISAELEKLGRTIETCGQIEIQDYKERCADSERRCLIETGYSDRFEWTMSQWGTPWNVCEVGRSDNVPDTIYFISMGTSPFNPLLELSRLFPDVVIVLDYCDQCWSLLGRAVLVEGDGSNEHYSSNSAAGENIQEELKNFVDSRDEPEICTSSIDEDDEWPSIIYVD
ncbi:MAG: hypothetical protein ACR2LC_10205 [Pyrinomonadaceae bacterium]